MSIKDNAAFNIATLTYQDQFGQQEVTQKKLVDYYYGKNPAEPGQYDGKRASKVKVSVVSNQPFNSSLLRKGKARLLAIGYASDWSVVGKDAAVEPGTPLVVVRLLERLLLFQLLRVFYCHRYPPAHCEAESAPVNTQRGTAGPGEVAG